MTLKQTKYELQNLLSGKSSHSYDALIQTIASYLRTSQRTSPMAEEKHQNKQEEVKRLTSFAKNNNLLIEELEEEKFIASGAEQKVYIKDSKKVIKLNDGVYYASWEDYFHNLLLHNYFFADTAYQFLGFYSKKESFYAVVQQNFVKADTINNLEDVQKFLTGNGFINTKNHDYYHPKLGIILEDLHD
ncbi:hypothetical protein WAF17_12090 [Bernardetia sp. ABR2-2B]|uniref:putative polyvalent protein kinase domain-containing protein n=1 Tax=Bernardetia sp. ABR2-2B TaxID=3127472 RepID=UPI0030CE77B1